MDIRQARPFSVLGGWVCGCYTPGFGWWVRIGGENAPGLQALGPLAPALFTERTGRHPSWRIGFGWRLRLVHRWRS